MTIEVKQDWFTQLAVDHRVYEAEKERFFMGSEALQLQKQSIDKRVAALALGVFFFLGAIVLASLSASFVWPAAVAAAVVGSAALGVVVPLVLSASASADKARARERIVIRAFKRVPGKKRVTPRLVQVVQRVLVVLKQQVQILTDVDNTVVITKNLLDNPEEETWLPNHALFPGALALQRAVAGGGGQLAPPGITLLSARFTEYHVNEAYQGGKIPQEAQKMGWSVQGIMYGTFADQVLGFFSELLQTKAPGRMERLGERKFQNFYDLVTRSKPRIKGKKPHPMRKYVFFGDNGEGDALAAQKMIKNEETRQRLESCWIHHVKGDGCPEEQGGGKIIYFLNYADAALKAYKKALISFAQLAGVIGSIKENKYYQAALKTGSLSLGFLELKEDVAAAERVLRHSGD